MIKNYYRFKFEILYSSTSVYCTNIFINYGIHLQTWMYIAFPVLLYIGERIFRAIRSGFYEVDILKVFDRILNLFNYSWRYFPLFQLYLLVSYLVAYKVACKGQLLSSQLFIIHFHFDINIQASLYPGKVLSLKMQKPEGFKYQSGMYIFLQCPQISAFQW